MTPIRLRDVGFEREGRRILEGVSADIPAGAATAVVGPSGAGKSTLLALIAGFDPPDVGTVENPFPRERTGVVLQAYGLVALLTAAENVELALQSRGLDRTAIRHRAAAELERFGLGALADRRAEELSGGQQQRLAIARALVIEPDLLIADELTSELDPRNRREALRSILALRERGVTVVLATHDLAVARSCDHVVEIAGAASGGTEGREARTRAADAVEREQRRRIAAQHEVVRRERARLADLERALERLLAQRDDSP